MKFNMIVNVGIKQSQKEKISELISGSDRYKSINEFVQGAVSNFIIAEQKKQEPSGKRNEYKVIFENINKVNTKLLGDELLGFHKLTNDIVKFIEIVKDAFDNFEYEYRYSSHDRIKILLRARYVKNILDQYISRLEDRNKAVQLGISDYNVSELKSLRDQFVHLITAQEVKG